MAKPLSGVTGGAEASLGGALASGTTGGGSAVSRVAGGRSRLASGVAGGRSRPASGKGFLRLEALARGSVVLATLSVPDWPAALSLEEQLVTTSIAMAGNRVRKMGRMNIEYLRVTGKGSVDQLFHLNRRMHPILAGNMHIFPRNYCVIPAILLNQLWNMRALRQSVQ